MPELPEVETIKRGLAQALPGLRLKNVEVLAPARFHHKYDIGELDKQKIIDVRRRAKVLIIDLDDGNSILFHLKMTGQLIFEDKDDRIAGGHPTPPLNTPLPNNSTHVIFTFSNGERLFFNDLRKFGWIKVMQTNQLNSFDLLKTAGSEPFDDNFTTADFYTRLQKRKKTFIKTALMDPTIIAGIGNIYSDEALWIAKIHPKKRVKELTQKQTAVLFAAIREILGVAISFRGSSSKTYVDHKGDVGKFLDFASVYHKVGIPCKRCGMPIVKEKINGRTAHFCPNCQKL